MKEEITIKKKQKTSRTIKYGLFKPAGNDTALVYGTDYDAREKKRINDIIMARHSTGNSSGFVVEQVGFISCASSPELQMAGGEFCGNATRSAASVYLKGKQGKIEMIVNSKDHVNTGVDRDGKAWCEIPLYYGPDVITKKEDGIFLAKMHGMVTVVIQPSAAGKYLTNVDDEQLKAYGTSFIHKYHLEENEAVGVMFCENKGDAIKINPIVWVNAIDTLFYETACGSGTTATAMVYAFMKNTSLNLDVVQPSGLIITASIVYKEGVFEKATIVGDVETDGKLYTFELEED